MERVAFLGLGNMGGPMAANLIKAGYTVAGFDPSIQALARHEAAGGIHAATPAEAVRDARIVVSMLPAGAHVEAALIGARGIADHVAPGTLFIDCSTIDVGTARRVSRLLSERGHAMVDAPVSGGVMGAAAATLTFMVGGEEEAFRRAEPLLSRMGKAVIHAGGPGNGQAAKICNNMLLGISMIGTAEAFALADKLGLDRQRLFDIASKSSGQCWSLTTYCPVPGPVPTAPSNRDYQAGFAVAMMLKDLKLAQLAAAEAGVATPLGAQAEALYQLLANQGAGERDFSVIFKLLAGELGR